TDGEGNAETVNSSGTAPIAGSVAVNDGAAVVTVTGTATEHQTLTATVGADPDGAGTVPTIQWLRDGVSISGATSATYTLTADDVGHSIVAQASYTDAEGFSESPKSNGTAAVAAFNDGAAAVSISGTAAEHQTLTAVVGADPDGAG